ncbi:hypothetical protein N473_10585 [Pseudoalteromonas luteoviolacea CPMOR-1]|uniref:CopG family transcriptional regulator n=1 Tax=Pseudoalteromonas luteoviolacea CPMOR-1 TaxID=1365248 RepID=A0A161YU89_9GAMM|nr:hypothetical protein [Pseudoalteromonas luteoviolacea]KZN66007.1 hypothetical protein N473_10585 [Pseudoalteromonas luteoviolacea CPMOR-1]
MTITLHGNVAELVQAEANNSGFQSPEDLIFEAVSEYVKKRIDSGIEQGLEDVESGDVVELDANNISKILSKSASQW